MRVLVTGGAGFIGGNLVRRLLQDGLQVAVLDDFSTGLEANLIQSPNASLFRGSILDAELLDVAASGCDAIVHLAARPSVPRSLNNPLGTHEANATGTLQVLEAARRAGQLHVVLASSSSVYGSNPVLPKHEGLRTAPLSPYGVSKLATEAYASAYSECYGLPTLPFRFFNVFGPLQAANHAYAAVIPKFIQAALNGSPLPLHGDGLQTRDFTYVGTVVEVIARALRDRVATPGPVNLAFGSRRTLLEVIETLGQLLNREKLEVENLPPRPGDVRDSQADQALLRTLFRDVDPVPFRDGLDATVAWFIREHR